MLEILSVVMYAFLVPPQGVYIQASESISGNRISYTGLRDFQGESLSLLLTFS
jgi:hypothetical protein